MHLRGSPDKKSFEIAQRAVTPVARSSKWHLLHRRRQRIGLKLHVVLNTRTHRKCVRHLTGSETFVAMNFRLRRRIRGTVAKTRLCFRGRKPTCPFDPQAGIAQRYQVYSASTERVEN